MKYAVFRNGKTVQRGLTRTAARALAATLQRRARAAIRFAVQPDISLIPNLRKHAVDKKAT